MRIAPAHSSSVLLIVLRLQFCLPFATAVLRTAQPDILNRAWLSEQGAFINGAIKVGDSHHGGALIRGIVAAHEIAENDKIVDIPRRLWFVLDRFPSIQKMDLSQLGSLCSQDTVTLENLKMAAAIALETKKGDASEFAPFLRVLPTLEEYWSFLPQRAEAPLLSEFGDLPVLGSVKLVQEADSKSEQCFSAWKRYEALLPGSLAGLSSLTWPEMQLALARFRTRCYIVEEDNKLAMIPGSDLFNTGEAEIINTEWDWEDGHFILRAMEPIEKGTEVFDPYCESCDNDYMVNVWGVYLEKNKNELEHKGDMDCNSHAPLRRATEAALNLNGGAVKAGVTARAAGMTAPRCYDTTMRSLNQGPLRCSLARLAWEYCAEEWGYLPGHRPPRAPPPTAHFIAVTNVANTTGADNAVGKGIDFPETWLNASRQLADAVLRPWRLRRSISGKRLSSRDEQLISRHYQQ